MPMANKGLFDLENRFSFYGAYHRNPINILIHTIFVWPILFTTLVLFYFTPSLCELLSFQPQCFLARNGLFFNLSFFFALIYAVFYVLLDKRAGSLAALLCMACWVWASWLAKSLGFSLAWKVVLAAQVVSWTGQFLGHGLFEKRAPALLVDPAQAFVMAPFFVLLEVLRTVFGYEPYPGFDESVRHKIDAEVKEWEDNKHRKMS